MSAIQLLFSKAKEHKMMSDTRISSRRNFLKGTGVAMAGTAVAGSLAISRSAHAAGGDTLKIGLIGCGGRGTGAVVNALQADRNAKLAAMADVFAWRIQGSLSALTKANEARYDREKHQGFGDKIDVPPECRFVGFDAYEQLLQSGVDVVIITVPSYFTPIYLKAAIDAGKHVFCEKTHAVDAKGVKMVMAATEQAREKGLCMARSSMMAIMSTLCSYTGQEITWQQAMNSKQELKPERYAFDADPPTKPGPDGRYPIPVPGVTKFF